MDMLFVESENIGTMYVLLLCTQVADVFSGGGRLNHRGDCHMVGGKGLIEVRHNGGGKGGGGDGASCSPEMEGTGGQRSHHPRQRHCSKEKRFIPCTKFICNIKKTTYR